MKVLLAIPSLQQGGAERLVLEIARGLRRQGVDARLVCFEPNNAYAEAYPELEPHVVQEPFSLRFLRGLGAYPVELERFLNTFQPDIVHSHLFAAELRTRSTGYRPKLWVSHLHDNMRQFNQALVPRDRRALVERYERSYLLKRYKELGKQRFLSISKDTSAYFQQHLPKALGRHIHLLPNAIDVDRFRPKGEKPMELLKMCNIGSFQAKKNQRFLLEVAAILRKTVPFELHFFGDGPMRQEVEAASKAKGLDDALFFHGNVAQVNKHMEAMNLYVHSATYEPFGLVLLEAMAAHLPVVCLNGRGNADFIEDGKNGTMVEPADPQEFADAVLSLWQDPGRYNSYRVSGAKTASEYGMESYVHSLLSLYADWLAE